MHLSSSTKEKIMNVRDYYDRRGQKADVNFMDEVLCLVQKDENFADSYNYNLKGNKRLAPAYANGGTCYFNIKSCDKWIKRNVKIGFSQYPKENIHKYYNLMALEVIFHESSHIWQQNGLEAYPEINRLYKDSIAARTFEVKSLRSYVKAIIIGRNLSKLKQYSYTERQANIDAFRELVEMYQGYDFLDVIEFLHINNLAYKPVGESIVHDTLNKIFLDFTYNCEGIPQNLLFEVGLPTDKEYSDSVYKAIEQYYNDEISYQRVMKKFNAK